MCRLVDAVNGVGILPPMTTERYFLTQDEATGFWFINDDVTGKVYETCTQDYAVAKEALADHIMYTTDK